MTVPRFPSAGADIFRSHDETFVVGSVLERDLAFFASRMTQYRKAGASDAMCASALSDTGLRLVNITNESQLKINLPITGAVVSGGLSISYFFPLRDTEMPRKPVLSKKISEGSTFYISRDTDVALTASPDTWLVLPDTLYTNGGIRIAQEAPVKPSGDFSSLSHTDLLDQIDAIEFEDVSDLVATAQPLLAEIASRRDLLRELISNAKSDSNLRRDCELLNEFYKYVLYRSRKDTRLRLHVFRPDAELSPHAHRWALASYVLSGPVMNKYYGTDNDEASLQRAATGKANITHRLQTGCCYAFDDTVIHWFLGAPGSATLTLRGPAVKRKAPEFRPSGLISKFGVDAEMEPSLIMTAEQFEYGIRHLEMTNVL